VNIPGFLYPIIVLEVLAVFAVICGLWLLFTDMEVPEVDEQRRETRGRRSATAKKSGHDVESDRKAPKSLDASGPSSARTPTSQPVDSPESAVPPGTNTSEDRPRLAATRGRVVLEMTRTLGSRNV
jgi:hypothetical protein